MEKAPMLIGKEEGGRGKGLMEMKEEQGNPLYNGHVHNLLAQLYPTNPNLSVYHLP
jgi:hypothetical protein